MILIPLNPMLAPWILAVWALDVYLVVLAGRILFGIFTDRPLHYRHPVLEQGIEGPARELGVWVARWSGRRMPPWSAWLTLMAVLLLGRWLLFAMIVGM